MVGAALSFLALSLAVEARGKAGRVRPAGPCFKGLGFALGP